MAWQIAFFVFAREPVRFRPLIVPSMIEKFGYGTTLAVLCIEKRVRSRDLFFSTVDLLLGCLFLTAYYKTRSRIEGNARSISTDLYIAGDLMVFTMGFAISVLLLVLTLRARKLPGTPPANLLLALFAFQMRFGNH